MSFNLSPGEKLLTSGDLFTAIKLWSCQWGKGFFLWCYSIKSKDQGLCREKILIVKDSPISKNTGASTHMSIHVDTNHLKEFLGCPFVLTKTNKNLLVNSR